jgi:hypothetical protein
MSHAAADDHEGGHSQAGAEVLDHLWEANCQSSGYGSFE